jgi:hypothetical protein
MLRSTFIALASLAIAAGAAAQDGEAPGVAFMLRPTVDGNSGTDDDFWEDQLEEDLGDGIGPPMAGPTGEEPIGPPLAGPTPSPPEDNRPPRRPDEPDPFAAIGVQAGSFIIRPAIEVGVSISDNPAGSAEKESGVGFIVAPELSIRSETDRHEIEADFRGEAILYGDEELDEREAEARVRTRYDLTSRTSLDAEAGYRYELDRFTDPDTPAAAVERPPVHELDASLGVTQRFGRAALGLAGVVERDIHEDVPLSGGGTASREELNNTRYGLRLRASYEASGTLTPFVEAAAGRRAFDQKVDDSGFERSSVWGELRGGLIFDRGEKLRGEVSLGYRREDLDDDRLDDLDALVADASIFWSPRRLTEVRFDLSTETQPTSIPDSAGDILYSATLTVTHELTPRFRIEGGAALEHERFVGADRTDVTYSAFAGATYAINRVASLKARYVYERTDSTDPDADADSHTVGLRLRIQR